MAYAWRALKIRSDPYNSGGAMVIPTSRSMLIQRSCTALRLCVRHKHIKPSDPWIAFSTADMNVSGPTALRLSISYLDTPELQATSTTSHEFRHFSCVFLFESIELNTRHITKQWASAIATNPLVASYVRTMTIGVGAFAPPSHGPRVHLVRRAAHYVDQTLAGDITNILRVSTNITALHIPPLERFLYGCKTLGPAICALAQLRSMSMHDAAGRCAELLGLLSGLQQVTFHSRCIQPSFLDMMCTFCSSASTLTSLSITGNYTITIGRLVHLTSCELAIPFVDPRDIISAFPHLLSLRLGAHTRASPPFDCSDIHLVEFHCLPDALVAFSGIRVQRLSLLDFGGDYFTRTDPNNVASAVNDADPKHLRLYGWSPMGRVFSLHLRRLQYVHMTLLHAEPVAESLVGHTIDTRIYV